MKLRPYPRYDELRAELDALDAPSLTDMIREQQGRLWEALERSVFEHARLVLAKGKVLMVAAPVLEDTREHGDDPAKLHLFTLKTDVMIVDPGTTALKGFVIVDQAALDEWDRRKCA